MYRKDALDITCYRRLAETDPDLNLMHHEWERALRKSVEHLPGYSVRVRSGAGEDRMKRVLAIRGTDVKPHETAPYETALQDAGLEPVVVSPGEAKGLDGFDGLLLMGGSDVNPARYGERAVPETQPPDDARDEAEAGIISEAMARDIPVLAICRGLQMLNVQQGGTLVQHLDERRGHRVKTGDRSQPVHEVAIVPGTKLAGILGEPLGTVTVNSRHHQAADRIGERLVISARARDGVVEGLERPDKRFVVAVQWHPENQATVDERQARLFRAFAAAVDV